jgi:hypothetical protein
MCKDCFTTDLLVKANPNNESLAKMIMHLCWGDLNTSMFFISEILGSIKLKRSTEDLKYHFKILSGLMTLSDDI